MFVGTIEMKPRKEKQFLAQLLSRIDDPKALKCRITKYGFMYFGLAIFVVMPAFMLIGDCGGAADLGIAISAIGGGFAGAASIHRQGFNRALVLVQYLERTNIEERLAELQT